MRFVCLIYFDPKKVFDQSANSNAVLADTGPHDAKLRESGHLLGGEALTLPQEARTVRVRDGESYITDGPYAETKEVLGGFHLIEARDMDEALRLATQYPFARVGAVEVRPVVDYSRPRPKF